LRYSTYPGRSFISTLSSERILKTKTTGSGVIGIKAHQEPREIGVKRNIKNARIHRMADDGIPEIADGNS